MSDKKGINSRMKCPSFYLIAIIFLWIAIFLWVFYKGSINAGIWGEWKGLEIVLPLLISFFISSVIILPLYLIRRFLKNKRK